jgi:hypothetical protein
MKQSVGEQERRMAECLAKIQALCSEISGAIAALARNDLQAFKRHISVQETTCDEISYWCHYQAPEHWQAGKEFMLAHAELRRLNLLYSVLIRRSSRNAEFFIALCKSCGSTFGQTGGVSESATLSCEI